MITKLNPDVIQDGSITAEKLADGIANDIISSLSTQSTLPSLTDYYIGQNAGGHTDTYFKKTLQSIGSVFQHELYDKVYLKDGSDPTFGNITAWQLNLSENSSVWYADGFGLALGVNDCAFLVGEEDGVYYLDTAGNTQTMLHSGNIGNYKLSQFTDDVVAGKYLSLSGGTLSNAEWRSQLTIERSGSTNDSVIAFKNSNGLLGCLGYRGDDGVPCVWLGETGTGVPIIHANNIGNYNAGSADSANKLNAEYLADLNNGTRGRLFYSAFQAANTPPGANYFAGLTFGYDSIKQIAMSYDGKLYTRYSNKTKWSDWKKVAFTSDIPTKLSQLTDDVVAGKYLPLSGGTIVDEFAIKAHAGNSAAIWFKPNDGAINHWLGVNSAGVLWFSNNGWSQQYDILHSGNIGNYNAGSATKLQTPRKLWGNDFDGSANIGGDITLNAYHQDGRQLSILQSGSIKFSTPSSNGWVTGLDIYASDKTTLFTSAFGVHGIGEDVRYAFIGGTYDHPNVVVPDDTGNVGIGIGATSPTERLDVSGNIKASGNIICSNLVTTGMINQTANSSYIVHNAVSNGDHKMWITDGVGKSISAGNAFNLDAINIISDKSLVLGAHLDYNIRVLKANNRIAKVIDSVNYSTLLPYKTPVAISSTYSSDPHNVAMADNTLYIVYENEADDHGCTILSFPTNDGSTPLTCGLLYTTYADSTGEFSCPTVIWSYNITPLMEPDATFEMWFTSYDGGTTWYGTHTVYK